MPAERKALQALAGRVDAFHISDRRLRRVHDALKRQLANGTPEPQTEREYLQAVARYFTGFEREARSLLDWVERKLKHTNQVHFNLTSERAVAVRRIEATRDVLETLRSCGREAR